MREREIEMDVREREKLKRKLLVYFIHVPYGVIWSHERHTSTNM